jgi:hypothetical protein
MSILSRRSLVTSAAALPALAVPAVALAVTAEPDPVFAAIGRFEEALRVEVAGFEARSNAQDAFRDRHGSLNPSGLIREVAEILEKAPGNKGKNVYYSLSTHADITELKGDLAQFKPFFHRTLNIQTDDYAKNVAPFEEACDRAFLKRYDAMQAVFGIVPTTLAGMRAKIDFAVSTDHVMDPLTGDDEALHDFLNTLYKSASLLAVQS